MTKNNDIKFTKTKLNKLKKAELVDIIINSQANDQMRLSEKFVVNALSKQRELSDIRLDIQKELSKLEVEKYKMLYEEKCLDEEIKKCEEVIKTISEKNNHKEKDETKNKILKMQTKETANVCVKTVDEKESTTDTKKSKVCIQTTSGIDDEIENTYIY